jgi:transposase
VDKEKGCMSKKYEINLSEEQRQELLDIVKKGSAKARTIRRAHTLLMAADGKKDEIIAETLHISVATVERTRKQFCCENLEATLKEKKRPGKPRKLTNFAEAYLIATTCSDAPTGSTRWTLRMLANQLVSLEIVDSLSKSTVGRVLKKTS